ncbi:MmyB family transcriptional regulator [Streptomyces sp. SD31]|uniref:MmyB family transcriptional regulator n=1 Tax=Streptomyces sp. SD31 TaxID=3452208 RepID=UPI003F8BFAB9
MSVSDPEGLRRLLATSRARCAPASYAELPELRLDAGLPARPLTGPAGRGLSQLEVDLLARLPQRTTGRLERGLIAAPTDDVLRAIAGVLRYAETEWEALWLAVYGQRPSPSAALHPGEASAVPPLWYRIIETSPMAAYISDLAWDVVTRNETAEQLWGGMPSNIMLWILGNRSARETVMLDWAGHWAPLAVSQLRNVLREHPRHRRLCEIRDTVLADAEVAALWQQYRDPYLHPDGDLRRMRHAATGQPVTLYSAAAEPLGAPGCRVILMETKET